MLALTVRRVSSLFGLALVALVLVSATSCAQVLGIDKEYKKGRFAPTDWTCFDGFYDEVGAGAKPDKSACDCACGIYDPDCDESDIAVNNHRDDEGETIDDAGNDNDPSCRSCDEDGKCSTLSP